MRNRSPLLSALLLAAAVSALSSCSPKPTRFALEREIPLAEGRAGAEARKAVFYAALVDLGAGGAARDLLRAELYGGSSAADYAEAAAKAFAEAYRAEAGPLLREFPEGGAFLCWEDREETELAAASKAALVAKRVKYEYRGGAHGMTTTRHAVLDLGRKERLEFDDAVVGGEAARAELAAAAERALGAALGLPEGAPLTEGGLFRDALDLPADFWFAAEGLGLGWDPYEAGPYALGRLEAVVPWAEAERFLTDRARALARSLPRT